MHAPGRGLIACVPSTCPALQNSEKLVYCMLGVSQHEAHAYGYYFQ